MRLLQLCIIQGLEIRKCREDVLGHMSEQGRDPGGQKAMAVEPQALFGLPESSWLI